MGCSMLSEREHDASLDHRCATPARLPPVGDTGITPTTRLGPICAGMPQKAGAAPGPPNCGVPQRRVVEVGCKAHRTSPLIPPNLSITVGTSEQRLRCR